MSRPAPLAVAIFVHTAMELRLTARRGENLLAVALIPVAVLVFFATTGIVVVPTARPVDFLLPGSLALAVIATGLVNLGIATAYERHYGVLKRLGGTPLSRTGLVGAKVAAVAAIVVVQVVLLVAVATAALGWAPGLGWSPAVVVAGLTLGTVTFAGLGLLLAGALRAEATLAVANGLFIAAVLLGGVIIPTDHLSAPLAAIAEVLPAAALSETLRVALGAPGDPSVPLLILGAWMVAAVVATVRTFRWE